MKKPNFKIILFFLLSLGFSKSVWACCIGGQELDLSKSPASTFDYNQQQLFQNQLTLLCERRTTPLTMYELTNFIQLQSTEEQSIFNMITLNEYLDKTQQNGQHLAPQIADCFKSLK